MLCNLCLSEGQEPPKKHCCHGLMERIGDGKQRVPQVPEGPSLRSLVLVGGSGCLWSRSSGSPRAPWWRRSMRSARHFHTLWVMPARERSYDACFTGEDTAAGEKRELAKISPN